MSRKAELDAQMKEVDQEIADLQKKYPLEIKELKDKIKTARDTADEYNK